MKRIAFGCDHVGFILKEDILAHLRSLGIEVVDKGAWSQERADYPHFAGAVAEAVVNGEADGGILICGTGVGISITANKFPGIRAVVCSEPYSAQLSRQHNNTNILAFGSRVVGLELAKMIVDSWLNAEFEGGRHQKRVEAIGRLEQQLRR
ncbi:MULTISPECIES: bifunctional allose-6-phosphate isomerase/ribose-5-phosphate isomerase RpiB [unclassified Brenneria]|uniref:bifunctional allose-6-phosphate isomerase/ribose-5-phosphate isomerase RpiB n=1 Tax=unclassified Brenneria TaxID=2634434 RepID=UPI0029C4E3C7|nr:MULTISPECIES: bifunctional allose-6-phosphate isomerase/ribose-5-phosphate isomerase RpiB [unclassified Brenneria]MDX5629622.1 bifunctional allose-6-phosphate isomerase/ribose-5-phosphate isomerase RpiB [Brenneria sp. L3-3Z]MDX5696768.1 bifunctional allose-6-phosphate isomerase/ribose-5-phosphate isomerase RpiB [Brenneria sp. L4-2C]MEE3663174.1 bifunctional allose-6-phosphate isomerase/ribose-5-phosphate isomerase RpiB [Brenneria sp. g21c3]